jgi:hypothetical protein
VVKLNEPDAVMARPSKEYEAFRDLTDKLLAVPKSVVDQRKAAYREQAAQNPRKRGPKPKVKPSPSSPGGE